MVDQDFDGFLAQLWEAGGLQEWQGIIDLALDAIPGWPPETCRAWVQRLEEMPQLVPEDAAHRTPELAQEDRTFDSLIRLLEALLARLATLGVPDALSAFSDLLRDATCVPVLIDIPRRYLVAIYPQWIDHNFMPGVCAYHALFVRRATAQEKVAAAKRAIALDNDVASDMGPRLVADALPHVLRLEPELLPEWLDLLEKTPDLMEDPQLIALCSRYRALWRRLPFGAALPSALWDYFAAGELHRVLVSDAKAAVDGIADDVVRMPKELLGILLERDMLLLMAQLPQDLELVSCDEAKALLRDYRRLVAFGVRTPLNLSLLLTRAIEAQLHHALGTGHDLGERSKPASREHLKTGQSRG